MLGRCGVSSTAPVSIGAVLQHTSLRRGRFAGAVLDGCESIGYSFQDADLTTARLFHRTRDTVAEVLRADADDDIERTSAAGRSR